MTVIKWLESYNTIVEQFDREHHNQLEPIDVMSRIATSVIAPFLKNSSDADAGSSQR